MSEPESHLEGKCLCGQVSIRVDGQHDAQTGACHCRMCQRWSGGLFLCFRAAEDAVTVQGPATRFASTEFAERAFCATCGSHLWMRYPEDPYYDLLPGLFEAARAWPLGSEIYSDRAMEAVRLKGDHPRKTQAEYEAKHPHTRESN